MAAKYTEAYQLEDMLHDSTIKTIISIIDDLGLETLQTRRDERQQLLKCEEQQGQHGERHEPNTAPGQAK